MKIVSIKDLDPHEFVIKWRCTYACNYKCSYCYQNEQCRKGFADNYELFETAKGIRDLIARSGKKDVELMLIGGEVSLLDLHKIMGIIDNVSLLHITTNLYREADYYNTLNKIVSLEICASFHHEYTSAKDFVDKVRRIDCPIEIEAVYNDSSKKETEKLISLCKQFNTHYQIDFDRLNSNAEKIYESNKLYPRLEVSFDNGEVRTYNNKNDLFVDKDIEGIKSSKYLPLKNKRCSWGSDYLYIKGNKVFYECGKKCELKDWKEQKNICQSDYCSFCGRLNITD